MTTGAAASLPGGEPAAPLPSFPLDVGKRTGVDGPMPENSDTESEIAYPMAPDIVSWPRVFPQL